MSNVIDILPGVAVMDFETALPWYENLFGRPADDRPMDGLAEWLFGGARLQLVEDSDRRGKSTVTLVLDDIKAYCDELEERDLTPEALDETSSDKVLFSFIADPEGNRIAHPIVISLWRSQCRAFSTIARFGRPASGKFRQLSDNLGTGKFRRVVRQPPAHGFPPKRRLE